MNFLNFQLPAQNGGKPCPKKVNKKFHAIDEFFIIFLYIIQDFNLKSFHLLFKLTKRRQCYRRPCDNKRTK